MVRLSELEKRLRDRGIKYGANLASTLNNMVAAGILPHADSHQRTTGFPEWVVAVTEYYLRERAKGKATLQGFHLPVDIAGPLAALRAIAEFRVLVTSLKDVPALNGAVPDILEQAWDYACREYDIPVRHKDDLLRRLKGYKAVITRFEQPSYVGQQFLKEFRCHVSRNEEELFETIKPKLRALAK